MAVERTFKICGIALGFLASLVQAGVWMDVPFVRQSPDGCGSASLAMLVAYWRMQGAPIDALSERQIYDEIHRPGGITAAAMVDYAKRIGFDVYALSGNWSDLEGHVRKGRPVIVAIDGGGRIMHYAVVTGIGDDTISLNDPADRKLRQQSRADFEKKWSASERWTLLAVPAAGR